MYLKIHRKLAIPNLIQYDAYSAAGTGVAVKEADP